MAQSAGPSIEVEPLESLSWEPVSVRATGLRPGSRVTMSIERTDDAGVTWGSQAQFVAGDDGMVDPAVQAPLAGDYKGVDQAGLFWSIKPTSGDKPSGAFGKSLAPQNLTASLESDGKRLASREFVRLHLARGVERVEVREDGVIGTLFLPEGDGARPAILVLSGSEGGTFEPAAAQYAARGYVTFALAYFGMDGLPDDLEEIPVETVKRGLHWLKSHPRVKGDSLGAWGASKGAELALLSGSLFDDIKAVVAKSASAYVFEAIGENMGKVHKSSWTYRGKSIPFVAIGFNMRIGASFGWARMTRRPWSTRPMYSFGIKRARELEMAAIKVENINGPVLVTGGGRDGVWPSDEMARVIADRLKSEGHHYDDCVLTYPDAGHQIASPYTPTSINYLTIGGGFVELLGGTPVANARASEDSAPKIIEFLAKALPLE
jgi:dipeptidyl aminopeptidase/acylaminoacyl peptidase